MYKIAFLLLLALVLPAFGRTGRRETNAQRLARGENPLTPRRLFVPSAPDSALRAKRSATAGPPPSNEAFNCYGSFSDFGSPVCCPSEYITFTGVTDGDNVYSGIDCFVMPVTIGTGSSIGCPGTDSVPFCCGGGITASGPPGSGSAAPYGPVYSPVSPVSDCENPIFV